MDEGLGGVLIITPAVTSIAVLNTGSPRCWCWHDSLETFPRNVLFHSLYTLEIRKFLLTIKVPDSTNSKENG